MTTGAAYYDPVTHTYTVDGEPWPSVTQVLTRSGRIDARWYTPDAAERGRRVHRFAELLDQDPTRPAPDDIGAEADAYRALLRDVRPVWAAIEEPFWCWRDRFCGRPDRRAAAFLGHSAIVELKTGSEQDWHDDQTAGYQLGVPTGARYVVYLLPTGRYRLRPCRDVAAYGRFRRALRDVHESAKSLAIPPG